MGTEHQEHQYWKVFALIIIGIVLTVMIVWNLRHPYSTGWDEANYINRIYEDSFAYEEGGIIGLAKALLVQGRIRPPAHRLMMLPLSLTVGPEPRILRFCSILFFLLTLFFFYKTVAILSGRPVGYMMAAMLAICPGFVAAAMRIYTEPPLFLGIASSFYFLVRYFSKPESQRLSLAGLSCSLALGLLAKLTFVQVVGPAMLVALITTVWGADNKPRFRQLLIACVMGGILVSPFYALNLGRYLGYAKYAWDFGGRSLLQPNYLSNLQLLLSYDLGPLLAVVVFIVLALALSKRMSGKKDSTDRRRRILLVAFAAGAAPLFLTHILMPNPDPKITTAAVIPFLMVVAMLMRNEFLAHRWFSISFAILISLQGLILALVLNFVPNGYAKPTHEVLNLPVPKLFYQLLADSRLIFHHTLMATPQVAQWNWDKLYETVSSHCPEMPKIGYIGGGEAYGTPQIEYPWIRRNEKVSVISVWSRHTGDFNPELISKNIGNMDVLLTIPSSIGYPNQSQFNDEFYNMLANDSRFTGPQSFRMGTGENEVVYIFFRKAANEPQVIIRKD